MVSLDNTEEGITVGGYLARRIPSDNWFFSFLLKRTHLSYTTDKILRNHIHTKKSLVLVYQPCLDMIGRIIKGFDEAEI